MSLEPVRPGAVADGASDAASCTGYSYRGDTEVGGPSQHRVGRRCVISKCSVSDMVNNVYVVTCRATGAQLLIDAADEWPRLEQLLAEVPVPDVALQPAAILTTHRHYDHVRALSEAAAALRVPTWAGAADADELPVAPDVRLEHGDVVAVGELRCDVIGLRGHTLGSVALAVTEADGRVHLFSGDSLFPGGVGNTFGSAEAFQQLLADVTERVFEPYADSTWVYPGHGKDTTLGAERPHLAEWAERGW